MLRRALVLASAGLVVFSAVVACKSDDSDSETKDAGKPPTTGDGSFVDFDAGFEGITATVDGADVTFIEQRTAYGSSAGDLTTIRAFLAKTPANAGQSFVLTIDAEKPGHYECAVPGATLAYVKDDGAPTSERHSYGALATNPDGGLEGKCAIDITAYGDVGGIIEGTFEGTLYRVTGPASSPQTVSITNGRFRLRRTTDE